MRRLPTNPTFPAISSTSHIVRLTCHCDDNVSDSPGQNEELQNTVALLVNLTNAQQDTIDSLTGAVSVSVTCLSLYHSVCVSMFICLYPSFGLCLSVCVCVSLCMLLSLSLCLCLCFSLYVVSVSLSLYLPTCLSSLSLSSPSLCMCMVMCVIHGERIPLTKSLSEE